MAELILSELTRMGQGFCIIGLEAQGQGYRSVRPMPARSYAWSASFPHRRGERLRFELTGGPAAAPHVEDRQSSGWVHPAGKVSEDELVRCLRSAEVAGRVVELFGCAPNVNRMGAGAGWVSPQQATRSICGCEYHSLRFVWKFDRWRAELGLASGDILRGLPIVDHEWSRFLETAAEALGPVNQAQRLGRLLNETVARRVCEAELRFARLGLARANPQQQCWIMLDSLFPLPRAEWLDGVGRAEERPAVR